MIKMTLKPKDWMMLDEIQRHVKESNRHWSRTYIHYLIRNKRLKSFKIGPARLFLKSDVDECVASMKKMAPNVKIKN